ncbi:DUF3836 domain-containing protein [Bacteroidales bacterium OttesenSCG-928-M06]|nr:DUF3836 domain-containing protein [Bacteroidales bacterium OttesenSCG-928-M06]
MKNLTLVIVFSFIVSLAWAHNNTLLVKSDPMFSFPDSVVMVNEDKLSFSKTIFVYDKDNYVISEEGYTKEELLWVKKSKKIYEYDTNKNITLFEVYDGEEDEWIPVSREKAEFNDNSDLVSHIDYVWRNDQWEETGKKYIYTYDENFNKLTDEIFAWDEENEKWENSEKVEYVYDKGQLTSFSRFMWTEGNWVCNRKSEFTQEEEFFTEIQYAFVEGEWLKRTKIEQQYDKKGNLLEDQSFLFLGEEWTGRSRDFYSYDDNNNLTYHERAIYVATGWNNQSKEEIQYDSEGNIVSEKKYRGFDSEWYETAEDIYVYDDNGDWVRYVEHYVQGKEGLIYSSTSHYYYPGDYVGMNNLPTSGKVVVYLKDQELFIQSNDASEIIDIYSMDGSLIYTGKTKQIPVARLQKGILLIKGNDWSTKVLVP